MTRKILMPIYLLACLFTLISFSGNAQDAKAGKTLFRSKCGSCHDVSLKQKMTGPALEGVIDRWKATGEFKGKSGEEWLKSWILNWNDPVAAGMPYAVKMKEYDGSAMSVFAGQISDAEMSDIMAYLANPAAASPAKVEVAGMDAKAAKTEEGAMSSYTIGIMLAFIFLLLLVYILGKTSKEVDGMQFSKEEDGSFKLTLPKKDKKPFYLKSTFKSALMLAVVVILIFSIGKSAIGLGRQQGYQPTQPIRFSHELHAGKNKINCQYCHFTAADGKHANIPSVSTCMNCHKAVNQGPKYGKSEIQKIYDAVGWDGTAYTKTPKPVKWIRIHNLPDHVYFNHAQHVNAGKVECQTCHGPIETMEEVYQYAPLSMGWCINCHRNHDVQFVDNSYYKVFEKYHKEMKNGTRKRVTVSDIGGTECQKCHY
jgi:cytochrome c2